MDENLADIFTKPLVKQRFQLLREKLYRPSQSTFLRRHESKSCYCKDKQEGQIMRKTNKQWIDSKIPIETGEVKEYKKADDGLVE